MSLPIIGAPKYELTIPSTKQKVKFRPFLVKEEKALLLAQQSENQQTMLDTLKDVIKDCTFGDIDTDKLAMFDIEYIFVKLRAKSVGEFSDLTFQCNACNDPKAKMGVRINLDELEITFNDKHTDKVKLTDEIGVKLKYPGIKSATLITGENEIEDTLSIIVNSIDYIYDKDNIYKASEYTKEELVNFVTNLTQQQFMKLQEFYETIPKLEKQLDMKCPVCGHEHHQTVRGLENFF